MVNKNQQEIHLLITYKKLVFHEAKIGSKLAGPRMCIAVYSVFETADLQLLVLDLVVCFGYEHWLYLALSNCNAHGHNYQEPHFRLEYILWTLGKLHLYDCQRDLSKSNEIIANNLLLYVAN